MKSFKRIVGLLLCLAMVLSFVPTSIISVAKAATTTTDTTTFSFDISAAGKFYVDWGDGSDVQVITRTSTSNETYTHTYNTAGEYQIKIDGKATLYGSYAAISFYNNKKLAKIDGSLGQIFSTLSDGTQPRFGSSSNWRGTFQGCKELQKFLRDSYAIVDLL